MMCAALAVVFSLPAAAQTNADRDAGFNAAVSAVRVVVSQELAKGALPRSLGTRPQQATALAIAPAQQQPASCADAKELEMPFELTLNGGRDLEFSYAGCREEERNDMIPPYTERYYKGPDGYGLTIITSEGAKSSEVLVSQGKGWVGDFDKLDNAKLVTGEAIALGDISIGDSKSSAQLRGVPDYPELKACETALNRPDPYNTSVFRDSRQKPYMGYAAARYAESSPVVMSLVLLTDTAAYYYSEPCDICADVDMCDLKTHAVKNVIHAHAIDCRDLVSYTKGRIVFDACAPR